MRMGDFVVFASMTLNASACLAYLWQGHRWQACYWAAAFLINLSLVNQR